MRQRRKYRPSQIAPERRREFIQAAIRDISANGFDRVTISTIADEAGSSRGLIGHYFTGKDGLLLEAVKSVGEELATAIQEAQSSAGPDPRARLYALIEASFTPPGFAAEHVAVWVSLIGKARWTPELSKIYRALWGEYRAGIVKLLARAGAKASSGFDLELVALTLSQLIEGFWVGWAIDPTTVSREKAAASCHAYVELVLSACLKEAQGAKVGRTTSVRSDRPSYLRS